MSGFTAVFCVPSSVLFEIVAPPVDRRGSGETQDLDVVRQLVCDAGPRFIAGGVLRAAEENAVVDDPVRGVVDDEDVVAAESDHRVGTCPAVDMIDRHARRERIEVRTLDIVVERVADAMKRHAGLEHAAFDAEDCLDVSRHLVNRPPETVEHDGVVSLVRELDDLAAGGTGR